MKTGHKGSVYGGIFNYFHFTVSEVSMVGLNVGPDMPASNSLFFCPDQPQSDHIK